MGPESTGKTTLARDLARHYGTVWLPEYLRIWLDAKGAVCEPEDLPKVVAGHQAAEAALARHANRVLFCDTDPLMTAVYSGFYYGHVPAWLDAAASARRADAYLLLDADVPWVPDPHRDMPHRRRRDPRPLPRGTGTARTAVGTRQGHLDGAVLDGVRDRRSPHRGRGGSADSGPSGVRWPEHECRHVGFPDRESLPASRAP